MKRSIEKCWFWLVHRALLLPIIGLGLTAWILSRKRSSKWVAWIAANRAHAIYLSARDNCPGYKQFLQDANAPFCDDPSGFSALPATDKEGYVKRYSIESRCLGGRIPERGVVIDESSGSSGMPNNWVRGPVERKATRRSIQRAFRARYGKDSIFLINCFALGAWATGMNVSMAMADLAILKSIGPDKSKLDATLRLFGPSYRYVIAGYPPFLKDWFSTTTLDLDAYDINLVVGGEGMSEGLRGFFMQHSRSVYSSYGASDLEINIGAETESSIALRRLGSADPALAKALFGRGDVPMIFQYNPLDYLVETTEEGELVVTILRQGNASPRIRYNIHDLGGVIDFAHVTKVLRAHGVTLSATGVRAPFLFVYGRNDLSVPFYGSKVFSTDIDQILNDAPDLQRNFFAFQISCREEPSLEKTLVVDLERTNHSDLAASDGVLAQRLFGELQRVNQDFREVSRTFDASRLCVRQYEFGTGPFANRDVRIKNRYVAAS